MPRLQSRVPYCSNPCWIVGAASHNSHARRSNAYRPVTHPSLVHCTIHRASEVTAVGYCSIGAKGSSLREFCAVAVVESPKAAMRPDDSTWVQPRAPLLGQQGIKLNVLAARNVCLESHCSAQETLELPRERRVYRKRRTIRSHAARAENNPRPRCVDNPAGAQRLQSM
jgi:hypothetical protein